MMKQPIFSSHNRSLHGESGFSLAELIVGMAVGMIILLTVSIIFINNNKARKEQEKTSQQIENGRYATQMMVDELHLAGYYGELDPSTMAVPASAPDACATTSSALMANMAMPIQGYDAPSSGPIVGGPSCITDVKDGTDVLVVRRSSTCIAGAAGCDGLDESKYNYFQVSLCAATLGQFVITTDDTLFTYKMSDCTTPAPLRSYFTRIYYVANNNEPGDGVPTLKVADLGAGAFSITPLVAGIDQMQVEYGIDTNGDGTPDVYTSNPETYGGCTGAACQQNWVNVTAAKIYVLARNIQSTRGYTDATTYHLGKKSDGSANDFGPFNDAYRRNAYTTLVRLNNVAGRRQ